MLLQYEVKLSRLKVNLFQHTLKRATQFCFALLDTLNETKPFNLFPGEAEERRNRFEKPKVIYLFIYENTHYITNSFRKNELKIGTH